MTKSLVASCFHAILKSNLCVRGTFYYSTELFSFSSFLRKQSIAAIYLKC